MFSEFEREAFRLETLDDYSQSGGVDAYRVFLSGGEQPDDFRNADWVTTVRDIVQAGKRIYRVHILSRPLTPYLRFELSWGYHRNMTAGEEFFILDITEKENPLAATPDFWLFDGETAASMKYSDDGKYLGSDVHATTEAAKYRTYRDTALALSVPFAEWWAEFGE